MGATYTRQSSYSDGDVITAAHSNDEFNQLLAAFASSSGHTHDGTTGEGGNITKMLGTSLTLGDGTSGTDITVTFDGETNDGVLKWMEDEDYFEFSDDILIGTTEKIQFRDTAIYINSSTDGQLDLVADAEIQIAATTIDINGNVDISGTLTIGSAGISETELEILDGATVTTDELNYSDTGAAVGTVVASKVVTADANKDVASFRNITLTGELDAGSLDVSGDADIDGTLEADAITIGGVTLAETISDTVGAMVSSNTETGISVSYDDSDNTLDFVLGASQTTITSLLATDIKIGEDDETKIDFETANEIHFYANNTEQVYVGDNIFGPQSDSDVDLGSTGVRWKDAYVDSITVTGNGDIDGDLDVDGTLEADAITVGGTALNTVIAGVTVTNATTAAVATTVTISDNESTDEDNAIIFTAGGDVDGGNIGLESDGDLTYNPSTGRLTATQLAGTLQTAAQANVTSLGTLTTLTVDNVIVNGATIGHTSDTDLITLASGVATVAGEISVTTLDIGGTNVTSTATELNVMDGDTTASSVTLADADRLVTNDDGTMKQVALSTLKTYLTTAGFSSEDPTATAIALG